MPSLTIHAAWTNRAERKRGLLAQANGPGRASRDRAGDATRCGGTGLVKGMIKQGVNRRRKQS